MISIVNRVYFTWFILFFLLPVLFLARYFADESYCTCPYHESMKSSCHFNQTTPVTFNLADLDSNNQLIVPLFMIESLLQTHTMCQYMHTTYRKTGNLRKKQFPSLFINKNIHLHMPDTTPFLSVGAYKAFSDIQLGEARYSDSFIQVLPYNTTIYNNNKQAFNNNNNKQTNKQSNKHPIIIHIVLDSGIHQLHTLLLDQNTTNRFPAHLTSVGILLGHTDFSYPTSVFANDIYSPSDQIYLRRQKNIEYLLKYLPKEWRCFFVCNLDDLDGSLARLVGIQAMPLGLTASIPMEQIGYICHTISPFFSASSSTAGTATAATATTTATIATSSLTAAAENKSANNTSITSSSSIRNSSNNSSGQQSTQPSAKQRRQQQPLIQSHSIPYPKKWILAYFRYTNTEERVLAYQAVRQLIYQEEEVLNGTATTGQTQQAVLAASPSAAPSAIISNHSRYSPHHPHYQQQQPQQKQQQKEPAAISSRYVTIGEADFKLTIKTMLQHKFIISPSGRGYDTHRTLEALMLGRIVIVKWAPHICAYEGLPVLRVSAWKEITWPLLIATWQRHAESQARDGYDVQRMFTPYWQEKMKRCLAQQ